VAGNITRVLTVEFASFRGLYPSVQAPVVFVLRISYRQNGALEKRFAAAGDKQFNKRVLSQFCGCQAVAGCDVLEQF